MHFAIHLVSRAVFSIAIVLLLGCGGSKGPDKSGSATGAKETKAVRSLSAEQLLEKMIATYKQCQAYSDEGVVRLLDGQGSKPTTASFSVQFKRPKFLHVKAYQLEVASDGEFVRAKIHDNETNHFDHQVVLRPIGEKIELADLYTDRELYEAMTRGLAGHPLQLELLLGSDPLRLFRDPGASLKLIAPDKFEGRRCFRLMAQNQSGRFVLWIDQENYLLRRIEFPRIQAEGTNKRMQLVAELRNARFQVNEPATYSIPESKQDRMVRFFVRPPQPLPSKLFGKKPQPFSFTTLDGKPVSNQSFERQTAVLAWFNDHPLCQQTLQQLETVRQRFAENKSVRFVAVAILPNSQTNETISALLARWKTNFEVVRDLRADGKRVFSVDVAPTIVVLGPAGRVQVVQEGMNPNLSTELPQVVSKVVANQNVAQLILREYRAERSKYEKSLQIAQNLAGKKAGVGSTTNLSKTPAAAARNPARTKLKLLWHNKELKPPGNLLLLPERKQLVAFADEGLALLDLHSKGKVIKRIPLQIKGRQTQYSYVRSWKAKNGQRWFAASAIRGQAVTVFDDQWKMQFTYPDANQPHEGIGDVCIADLDGDDKPELYVGFWGVVGLHQVIDGKRKRSNRLPSNIVSMTTSPANPVGWFKLLVTTNSGRLWQINQYLREDPSIDVPGWAVFRMAGNQHDRSKSPYIGLSYDAQDQLNAVALSGKFQEEWHYPLPNGVFTKQIELAHFGRIGTQKVWLLVAPDSSIHMISPNGEFSDNFALGKHLSGIALTQDESNSKLYIADDKGVSAYQLTAKSSR